MAIFMDNLKTDAKATHCVFESSRLKSSIVGHIYDAIVNSTGEAGGTVEAVDNGTAIAIGDFTGDGLQTKYAKIAAKGDKIAVVGTPALIKDAFTKTQEQPYNFYNKAGEVVKAYEVVPEDIFGVSKEFVDGEVTVGAKVVWDTDSKKYKVVSSDTGYGFVGKVHSIQNGTFYDLVRIECIKNAKA